MSSKCQSEFSASSRAAAEVIKKAHKLSNTYSFTQNLSFKIFRQTYIDWLISIPLWFVVEHVHAYRLCYQHEHIGHEFETGFSPPVFSQVSVRTLSKEDKSSMIKHCLQIEFGLKDKKRDK